MTAFQFNKSEKSAIVIGATGLVGKQLVQQLLGSGRYATVYQIVRRPVVQLQPQSQSQSQSQPNSVGQDTALQSIVINDFAVMEQHLTRLNLNQADAFSTLGTTLKQAGSKDAFRQVDLAYNLKFAQLVKKLGVQHFLLLSATGANARSALFYNKVKGELEQAVTQLCFEHLSIFQPSLLLGAHQDARLAENLAQKAFSLLKPVLSQTWKYRPIEAERVAQAMCIAAAQTTHGKLIYSNTDILSLTLENPA